MIRHRAGPARRAVGLQARGTSSIGTGLEKCGMVAGRLDANTLLSSAAEDLERIQRIGRRGGCADCDVAAVRNRVGIRGIRRLPLRKDPLRNETKAHEEQDWDENSVAHDAPFASTRRKGAASITTRRRRR